MTDNVLRLRPVTPAEFDDWLPRQEAGYAELIVASGAMSPEEAREKALRDTRRQFPAGGTRRGSWCSGCWPGTSPLARCGWGCRVPMTR